MKNKTLFLSSKLRFGKYKDKDLNIFQLLDLDPSYVIWIVSVWEGLIDYRLQDRLDSLKK